MILVSDEEDLYMSDEEPDEDDEDVDIGEKKEDSFSQVIQNNINNLKSQPKTNLRYHCQSIPVKIICFK